MVLAKSSSDSKGKKRFGPGSFVLLKAAQDRGRQSHNLWYHYSSRLRRDVVLKNDLAFAHFCLLEGDPRVSSYELNPEPIAVVIGHETSTIEYHALVTLRDGPPEIRMLESRRTLDDGTSAQGQAIERAATQAGFRCVRITAELLAPHQQLIANWRCALAFLASCRGVNLKPYATNLETRCRGLHRSTIEELLHGTNAIERPLYQAALLTCLQSSKLLSDLEEKPLCDSSLIWEARHE